ncbi:Uncharacterised protein [Mycoplasmopsis maculosa]|uniref:Uncharacterized protein n=1 Tax=Mycoplasmopsis maculosa TaxID=114885 RepID=A0A449B3M5_9BACT|nr:hypothetical protein [Mycoplasmopsis maculosa]VEU75204.1 Uncharacterised protein [Mycoplasmopsis maculosa]
MKNKFCLWEKIKKSNFSNEFKNWSLGYKLMFFFGIALLIVDIVLLFYYFWYHGSRKLGIIYGSDEITSLFGNKINENVKGDEAFYPHVLAYMWRQTFTFTFISNFMMAITMIITPFKRNNQKSQAWFFATIIYITVTFLIYWTLIFPTSFKKGIWSEPASAIPSLIVHAINPAFGFAVLILLRKDIHIKNNQIWLTSVFVFCYFLFAFITFWIGDVAIQSLNKNQNVKNIEDKYGTVIYPFLNFKKPFFYKGGNLAIVIILDILIFVLSIFLTPALGFIWKASLRQTKKTKKYIQ